jgi:Transposase IS4
MQRPRRNTKIPLRYRLSSSPQLSQFNRHLKRPEIDAVSVNRDNVDQALAAIAPAPECGDEPPTLLSTELSKFEANYTQNRPGYSRYTGLSESGFFKLFFSDSVVKILSEETNAYAEFHLRNPPLSLQDTRQWVPTTRAEIRVYLGVHLHFGLYPLAVRDDYWRMHQIGRFMGLKRFQQIHRFFSLNDETTMPAPSNAPWYHRVHRISDLVRTACRNSYCPSSNIAIDEAMVAFEGRTKDTVKLKNKPIDIGYKIWCIGDHGYIWSWLFHLKIEGVETFIKGQQTRWPQ